MGTRLRHLAGPVVAAVLAMNVLSANPVAAQQHEREIVERQQSRFDLWLYSQENEPTTSHQWKWLASMRTPFALPDGWKVVLRGDLPLLYTNKKGSANPDSDWNWGIGDSLGQVAFTTPKILPDLSLNFGLRLVMPTGCKSPFGASQWQIAPQIGIAWDLPLAPGLKLQVDPMLRYFHGFAPTQSGTTTKRLLDVYPTVSLALPDEWKIALWSENPMTYNERTNSWFVPFDVMVIKTIANRVQLGAGAAVRLIDTDPTYKYMFYGRASVFF